MATPSLPTSISALPEDPLNSRKNCKQNHHEKFEKQSQFNWQSRDKPGSKNPRWRLKTG
jgi:hypothetical protein